MSILGLGGLRFGGNLSQLSNRDEYEQLIAAPGDSVLGTNAGRDLVYMSFSQVVSWGVPITQEDAADNDWLLYTSGGKASGSEFSYAAGGDGRLADVSNTDYQTAWGDAALAYMAANPTYDGIHLDNFVIDLLNFRGETTPTLSYPVYKADGSVAFADQASYRAAQLACLAAVMPALQSAGKFIVVNAMAYITDAAGSDFTDSWNGQFTKDWIDDIYTYIDQLEVEYWQQLPSDIATVRKIGTDLWSKNWAGWQSVVAYAQSKGIGCNGLVYGEAADVQRARYTRASFLMEWDGIHGDWTWATEAGADPWNEVTALDPGQPTGAKEEVTSSGGKALYKREYLNSTTGSTWTIYVNPQATTETVEGHSIASGDALFVETEAVPDLPTLKNDFEGGTDLETLTQGSGGNTATPGNDYFDTISIDTNAIAEYADDVPMKGSMAVRFATRATGLGAFARWRAQRSTPVTEDVQARFYVYLSEMPTLFTSLFVYYTEQLQTVAKLEVANGDLVLRNTSGTIIAQVNDVVSAGQMFRIEVWTHPDTSAAYCIVRFYADPDADVADFTAELNAGGATTWALTNGNTGLFDFGCQGGTNRPTATGYVYVDVPEEGPNGDWFGPVVEEAPASPLLADAGAALTFFAIS